MPGWVSWAALCASARNRANAVGSAAAPAAGSPGAGSGRLSFTATGRPSRVSSARQTSPIAPSAILPSRRYRPPSAGGCGAPGAVTISLVALVGEDGLHDVAGDLGRVAGAAVPGVLQEHADRHGRRVVALLREAHEPAVVGAGVLRRPGLAGHLVAGQVGALAGAVG